MHCYMGEGEPGKLIYLHVQYRLSGDIDADLLLTDKLLT